MNASTNRRLGCLGAYLFSVRCATVSFVIVSDSVVVMRVPVAILNFFWRHFPSIMEYGSLDQWIVQCPIGMMMQGQHRSYILKYGSFFRSTRNRSTAICPRIKSGRDVLQGVEGNKTITERPASSPICLITTEGLNVMIGMWMKLMVCEDRVWTLRKNEHWTHLWMFHKSWRIHWWFQVLAEWILWSLDISAQLP